MTIANGLIDWFERLPRWAYVLLFPVWVPLMLAYSLVAIPVLFLFILPYLLLFRGKKAESPAARFTRAEVREHAESLDRWFTDTLTEQPDASDCQGVGPGLARELVQLARQSEVTAEVAGQFAERVGQDLKGYKGTPFFALHHLARRLAELTSNDRAA
jgi:hypothetical protein